MPTYLAEIGDQYIMFDCDEFNELGLANYFNEESGFQDVGRIFELKEVHAPSGRVDDTERTYMDSQPTTNEEAIRKANFRKLVLQ